MAALRSREDKPGGTGGAGSPAGGAARAGRRPTGRARRGNGGGPLYLAAGLGIGVVFVMPLAWEVFRSFQPESTVTSAPSAATFSHLTIANYHTLLAGQDDIIRNVMNSLIVAVLAAVVTAVTATLAGYGLAQFRFRGSGIVFGLVLLAFMVPFQAILTPLFVEMHFLHLLNSLVGLGLFYTASTFRSASMSCGTASCRCRARSSTPPRWTAPR